MSLSLRAVQQERTNTKNPRVPIKTLLKPAQLSKAGLGNVALQGLSPRPPLLTGPDSQAGWFCLAQSVLEF